VYAQESWQPPVRPFARAHASETTRIAQVIRAAFAQSRGVLQPPSGGLALATRGVRDLIELGGILACESEGRIVAYVFHRAHPGHAYLGRLAVLPAVRGVTVPTFAWLEKRLR
jgi:hypothetical protein